MAGQPLGRARKKVVATLNVARTRAVAQLDRFGGRQPVTSSRSRLGNMSTLLLSHAEAFQTARLLVRPTRYRHKRRLRLYYSLPLLCSRHAVPTKQRLVLRHFQLQRHHSRQVPPRQPKTHSTVGVAYYSNIFCGIMVIMVIIIT